MDGNITYFDNAATSYPKPEAVYVAADDYFRACGNPGRGAHTLAMESARAIFEGRELIANFLGASSSERLLFTPSCTYSINAVLKGLRLKKGDVVVTSALEHNSVMRPLRQLEKTIGIKVLVLPYADRGVVNVRLFKDSIRAMKPKLVIVAHASNVTGELVDVDGIAEQCQAANVPLLVDAAQTAGRFKGCLNHPGITYWCASGHKGMMGAPGVGLLFIRPDERLEPLVAGGTGSMSEKLEMPSTYPDRMEPGTIAGPAIAALAAGVDFIRKTGVQMIAEHEAVLTAEFRQWCSRNKQIKVYGRSFFGSDGTLRLCDSAPLVSFSVEGLSPDRVADILDRQFGIAVRSGLHCASQAHSALNTTAQGLTRVSFGYFNTFDELEALCDSLSAMVKIAL